MVVSGSKFVRCYHCTGVLSLYKVLGSTAEAVYQSRRVRVCMVNLTFTVNFVQPFETNVDKKVISPSRHAYAPLRNNKYCAVVTPVVNYTFGSVRSRTTASSTRSACSNICASCKLYKMHHSFAPM